jgi:hypothetical protein
MYHIRTYKGGGADHDPRQKIWAEFKCGICGHVEDVDITGRQHTFQFNVSRLCPKCKCHDKNDRLIAIKKEIEELTSTKDNIEVTIEELTKELEKLSETSTEVNK